MSSVRDECDRGVFIIDREERAEVVRYDRAGKWFAEYTDGRARAQLTLGQAVNWAFDIRASGDVDGHVIFNKPGGQAFYDRLRKREST